MSIEYFFAKHGLAKQRVDDRSSVAGSLHGRDQSNLTRISDGCLFQDAKLFRILPQ